MEKIINKYINRIKLDFPEDDKLVIDLQDFAKEISEDIKGEVREQLTELKDEADIKTQDNENNKPFSMMYFGKANAYHNALMLLKPEEN